MPGAPEVDVAVVGAGIVGSAAAAWLTRTGKLVALVDRLPPGEACSHGNAGMMSPGAVVPYTAPGTLRQIPKWLLDPLGPLAIRWAYLPRALPWLMRWVRSSTPERAIAVSRGLVALHSSCFDNYAPLLEDAGAQGLVSRVGQIYVSKAAEGVDGGAFARRLREDAGVRVEMLDADALRQMEPMLARDYRTGILFPDNGHCLDPGGLTKALAETVTRGGGRVVRAAVAGFATDAGGVTGLVLEGGTTLRARQVVVAAGAWSARLTAQLGLRLPLEAERGYHMMLPDPGVMPRHPLTNRDRSFAVTPMAGGLRLAGTAEIAGVDAPPNWRRAEILLQHAAEMLPGLRTEGAVRWMGSRPAMPDSLPVLGPCPGHAKVLLAFGNGHFGLTAASTMGRVTADLAAGRPPPIDISPFSATRFA